MTAGGKALSFETPGQAQGGGKEIVFEVEKKDSQTCDSYLVNKEGGSVQREIRLKHQAR
jgi:hypothetical protein